MTPKQIENWAHTLDSIRARGDGHGWPEIKASINWLHDSDNTFVVQSAASLKKKWDAIQANQSRSSVTGRPKPQDPYDLAEEQRRKAGKE